MLLAENVLHGVQQIVSLNCLRKLDKLRIKEEVVGLKTKDLRDACRLFIHLSTVQGGCQEVIY